MKKQLITPCSPPPQKKNKEGKKGEKRGIHATGFSCVKNTLKQLILFYLNSSAVSSPAHLVCVY